MINNLSEIRQSLRLSAWLGLGFLSLVSSVQADGWIRTDATPLGANHRELSANNGQYHGFSRQETTRSHPSVSTAGPERRSSREGHDRIVVSDIDRDINRGYVRTGNREEQGREHDGRGQRPSSATGHAERPRREDKRRVGEDVGRWGDKERLASPIDRHIISRTEENQQSGTDRYRPREPVYGKSERGPSEHRKPDYKKPELRKPELRKPELRKPEHEKPVYRGSDSGARDRDYRDRNTVDHDSRHHNSRNHDSGNHDSRIHNARELAHRDNSQHHARPNYRLYKRQPYIYYRSPWYNTRFFAPIPFKWHSVGHRVRHLPDTHISILVGAIPFFYFSGVFYRSFDDGYVVVSAPIGAVVAELPVGFISFNIGRTDYYYANDIYYRWQPEHEAFVVVEKPKGADAAIKDETRNRLYVYPNSNQSEDLQAKDRYECHQWAVSESGVDPTAEEEEAVTGQSYEDYKRAMSACLAGRDYTVK